MGTAALMPTASGVGADAIFSAVNGSDFVCSSSGALAGGFDTASARH